MTATLDATIHHRRGARKGFTISGEDDLRLSGGDEERGGAFVARVWHDTRGLRARIRHTVELADPEEVATVAGHADHVVPDLVGRFGRWIEDFAGRAERAGPADPGPGAPNDEPMTPQ
jgi:hypothetical protein